MIRWIVYFLCWLGDCINEAIDDYKRRCSVKGMPDSLAENAEKDLIRTLKMIRQERRSRDGARWRE